MMFTLPSTIAKGSYPAATNYTVTTYDYAASNVGSQYPGSGATATVVRSGNTVASITITNGGSGLSSSYCTVNLSGGGGSGATLGTPVISGGVLQSIPVTAAGSGYTTDPTVNIYSAHGMVNATTTRVREFRLGVPSGVTAANCRGILLLFNEVDSDVRGWVAYEGVIEFCARHNFVAIGTKHLRRFDPIDETADDTPSNGPDWVALNAAITAFATSASIPQLINCPLVCAGFSAGGQQCYGIGRAAGASKVIAAAANKGGFLSYYNATMHGTPMLYVTGQSDTASRRNKIVARYGGTNPTTDPTAPASPVRPVGALWAWVEEAGTNHAVGTAFHLLLAFMDECIRLRYPTSKPLPTAGTAPTLDTISHDSGWLVDEGHSNWADKLCAIRAAAGVTSPENYGWVPNQRIATLVQAVASYDSTATATQGLTSVDDGEVTAGAKKVVLWGSTSTTNEQRCGNNSKKAMRVTKAAFTNATITIQSGLTDWTSLEVYEGTEIRATYSNSGSNTILHPVYGDPTKPVISLHTRLIRPSGTFTSAVASFVATA